MTKKIVLLGSTGSIGTQTLQVIAAYPERFNVEVLTANNQGVDAANLHANTYLIIGEYSRFEDYGNGRTGCFWVG